MQARIARWGNSLAVRIPKAFAQELRLSEGTDIEITAEDGKVVVAPAAKRYRLDELVAGITPENRHDETDWGDAVGKEVW